uniref:Complement C1r subcomponent like n=1 Tax=Equus caballus TaxID=9796 RepID=A0A5F5PLQ9_HORSE
MPVLRVGNHLWGSPHSTSCPGKISQPVGWIQAGSVGSRAPHWAAPLVRRSFRPMSQANGGSEATHTPGDNPSKIQNHCQEPYYQAVPAGHGSVMDQLCLRFIPQSQ